MDDDILFTSKEHATADTYAKDVMFPGAHILGSKFRASLDFRTFTFTIGDIRKSKLALLVVSEEGDGIRWESNYHKSHFYYGGRRLRPLLHEDLCQFLQGETFRAAFYSSRAKNVSDLN